MRKLISTLTVCLITLSTALSASWLDIEDTAFDVGIGYRQDTLEFRSKIGFDDSSSSSSSSFSSGSGVSNDIREHDKFRDINLWQISAAGRATFCEGIYVRAYGDYAQVVDGRLHTRYDFGAGSFGSGSAETNGNGLNIRAKADNGYAYDFSIGLGYEFSLYCDQLKIAPVGGYSYDVQRFKSKDFRLGNSNNSGSSSSSSDIIVCSGSDCSSSDFSGSSYSSSSSSSSGVRNTTRTQWQGGWIGLDYLYSIDCDWNLWGSFEYHWAKMDVQFRTRFSDFCSTTKTSSNFKADANGPWFRLGSTYRFDECWSAGIDGDYYYMRSDKGRRDHHSGVRLDRATWTSWLIEAVIAYHF